jgi:hypothetical protein
MKTFKAGSLVTVRCYGGETATRRVVKDQGKRCVIVSNQRDYEKAVMAGRDPDGIGFPRQDIQAVESDRYK